MLCDKFGRQCNYEKQAKTRLTRSYLTEVENELVRTKALLQQFTASSDGCQNVDFGATVEHSVQASPPADVTEPQLQDNLEPGTRQMRDGESSTSSEDRNSHSTRQAHSQEFSTHHRPYHRASVPGRQSQAVSCLSLENSHSSSNFEWDERNETPNGEKFVDGMASLTSASHEGGYLGLCGDCFL